MRFLITVLVFFVFFSGYGQYTEVINSNRPGASQGAFSVGEKVLQVEGLVHYGEENHNLTGVDARMMGVGYEVRYGIWRERLELTLRGDFIDARMTYPVGGERSSMTFRDFRSNTLGAKYLLYDPYKKRDERGPNLYSWRKNNRFQLEDLIPAVSIYAGANLRFGDRPSVYPFYGSQQANISPKVALITQHNWGSTVFTMNFEFDYLTDAHKRFSGIFSLTQYIGEDFSVLGEFQLINNHFYSDELVRLGMAYLLSRDLQLNLSGLTNFKNTPDRWSIGLGASYRWDWHKDRALKEEPEGFAAENNTVLQK